MDQQNNTAALNDTAGVLPMDTGATVNGIHDENEHHPSSVNGGAKKGRGRPPKSAGSTKASVVSSDTPKRARGRPKAAETVAPIKKVVVAAAPAPPKKKEEPTTNGDASKKKRGRPSKPNTPNEPSNVISKPQVQPTPVINHQEQNNVDESGKKKRGRPSGGSPKKAVVVAAAPIPKEASPAKKRGRPSGSAGAKKSAVKPKAPATANGSAKKRGRPKKPAASSTGTPVATTPANETTVVTPNNVQ